ncbi:hypothetical protein [Georgenia yuyongxinii]|nr:hypothetical protein [Georgenia yuyongxinii]
MSAMFTDHLDMTRRTGREVIGSAVRGITPAGTAGHACVTTV